MPYSVFKLSVRDYLPDAPLPDSSSKKRRALSLKSRLSRFVRGSAVGTTSPQSATSGLGLKETLPLVDNKEEGGLSHVSAEQKRRVRFNPTPSFWDL